MSLLQYKIQVLLKLKAKQVTKTDALLLSL